MTVIQVGVGDAAVRGACEALAGQTIGHKK